MTYLQVVPLDDDLELQRSGILEVSLKASKGRIYRHSILFGLV